MQEGQDKTAVSGGVVTITPSGFISQVDQTHTHTHTHTHTRVKKGNPASFQVVETMQTAFSNSSTTV